MNGSFFVLIFLIPFCFGQYDQWIPDTKNPIINFYDNSYHFWNDPSVLKEGSTYVMYLTTTLVPGNTTPPVLPFRATSTDGIHWNISSSPVLTQPVGDRYDNLSTETPSVVKFNGKYHMYYTAISTANVASSTNWTIGHAVSDDGFNWTRDDNPVLEPTGNPNDFYGWGVGEPGAVVFNNTIYVFFTGGSPSGQPAPLDLKGVIGMISTTDGVTYTTPVQVIEQDPTLYPRSASGDYLGYNAYSSSQPTLIDGQVHLFHGVYAILPGNSMLQVALHECYATDASLTNWVQQNYSIFTTFDFYWSSQEIRAPYVMQEGDVLKMWFAGQKYAFSDIYPNCTWTGDFISDCFNTSYGLGYATYTRTPASPSASPSSSSSPSSSGEDNSSLGNFVLPSITWMICLIVIFVRFDE